MPNVYELRLYGVLYYKVAKDAITAKKKVQREVSKRVKGTVPLSHIKLVHYHRAHK